MTTNTSISDQPFPYMYGAHLVWSSNTTITVQPALCRDSTNNTNLNLGNYFQTGATNTVINGAVNGANGLDTGSLANNTWYAVFIIGSSLNKTQTATIISTSVSSPHLPENYDCFRRIGWLRTNGSAHFIKFHQSGAGGKEYYQWDSPINVLNGGTATTFTAVSLASAMPPQTTPVHINLTYTPALAANTASIRPTTSTAAAGSTPIVLKGTTNAVGIKYPTTTIIPLISSSVPEIDYLVTSSDTLTIDVVGFEDFTS